MSEPIGRSPPPSVYINVSPSIAPKSTNTMNQDGIASFLAGVVIGLALALTYSGNEDKHLRD